MTFYTTQISWKSKLITSIKKTKTWIYSQWSIDQENGYWNWDRNNFNKKVNGEKHNILKIPQKICFQTDLHLANFSRANGTFRWWMLSFQSPFDGHEVWIICEAICFKEKAYHDKKRWKLKTFLISEAATRSGL